MVCDECLDYGHRVTEELPDLNELKGATEIALSKELIAEAKGLIGRPAGEIYDFQGIDIQIEWSGTLENVNTTTVRCIGVPNCREAYLCLALMDVTFNAAGIELRIDNFAIMKDAETWQATRSNRDTVGVEVA